MPNNVKSQGPTQKKLNEARRHAWAAECAYKQTHSIT